MAALHDNGKGLSQGARNALPLVLFLAVFAGVALKVFLRKPDPSLARLPLEQDSREGR